MASPSLERLLQTTPTPSAPLPAISTAPTLRRLVAQNPAPTNRLEAIQREIAALNARFNQPVTGFLSELDRWAALLRVGPGVIEAALTRGRGYRKAAEARGVPETGSFGPAAVVAGTAAAVLDPLTPVSLAAGRLSGLARTARPSIPVPRQAIAEVAEAAPTPAVDTLAQRIAQLPRREGGVLLPRPAGTVSAVPTKPIPAPLAQTVLQEPTHRRITVAAGELFERTGIKRDPNLRVSDQITQLLESERLPVNELQATLNRHGLSITEFANEVFRPSIKDAARRLQALSALQGRINRLVQNAPQEAAQLRTLATEVDTMVAAKSLWQAPVRIWRAALVSQPATAVRNAITQVGRVGMDVIEQGFNAGLQKVTGKRVTSSPLEPLRALSNIFFKSGRTRARETTDAVLRGMPAEWDRLFGTFMSDVASGVRRGGAELRGVDKAIQKAEDGAAWMGGLNRASEFLQRRAIFEAALWQRLRARGKDLYQVIAKNEIDAIVEGDIRAATEKALEVTFGRQPQFGTTGYHFVKFVNKSGPILAPAVPFPRFMVEALRFYYEFSPAGALRLLNPAERAAVASGNFSAISRAVMGTAMLGAAYALRKSEHAGERWYEVKAGDRTVDLRPFNPFSPYLFVADIVKRQRDNTLYQLNAKDIVTALAGVNVRAGTGLYIMDQVIDQFTGEGRARKALDQLKIVSGEFLSGYLTPLQVVYDVLAEFDKSLQVIREERIEPFVGPFKSRIPGLAQTLPEAESPTRAGPMLRESPALRQVTGVTLKTKRPIETELDRLQFTRSEILGSTGNAEADRLLAKHMGPLVERILTPFIRSLGYMNLSDAAKAQFLRLQLNVIRGAARRFAESENPRLFAKLKFERRPARERRFIEELVAPTRE